MKTTLLVTRNIVKINGGLTKAIYHRANALAEKDKEVLLFTFFPNDNFFELVNYHQKQGNIHPHVKIFNMFQNNFDINNKAIVYKNTKYQERIKDGCVRFPDKNQQNSYRCFKDGIYHMYEHYNDQQDLAYVDYFKTPWTRTKKEFYHNGVLIKASYMDEKTNTPKLIVYYHQDGTPSISALIDVKTKKVMNYFHHDLTFESNDLHEVVAQWLQHIIAKIKQPVLFIDVRDLAKPILALEMPNSKKVFVLHAPHLAPPYTDKFKISSTCDAVFANLDKIDKFVCLTEEIKNDIIEVFGHADKFTVIPHFQDKVTIDKTIKKEKDLIVSIARYHPAKNLTDSIKAFKKVATRVPTAKYELYGYGPQEEELKEMIVRYRLQDRVFIKEFAEDPSVAIQRAEFTVLPSLYEGLGLVILESLAYGVPVVAYDCNYGPRAVIRNDVDGLLVPMSNVNKLAKAMVALLKDKTRLTLMAHNAPDVLKRFNKTNIQNQWLKLLEEI